MFEGYIFNVLKSKDIDKLTRFKLTPTPSDRSVFHDIVEKDHETIRDIYRRYYWGSRVPKNTPVRALRAYEEFQRLIDDFAQFGSAELTAQDGDGAKSQVIADETDTTDAIESRLEALLTSLLNRMKLVVITLEEDDDAQVIFRNSEFEGRAIAGHGSRKKQHFLSSGTTASRH